MTLGSSRSFRYSPSLLGRGTGRARPGKPTGTATGFVPKEGMEETEEEKLKTRPKGCGCEVIDLGPKWSRTNGAGAAIFFFLSVLGVGIVSARRRARG